MRWLQKQTDNHWNFCFVCENEKDRKKVGEEKDETSIALW